MDKIRPWQFIYSFLFMSLGIGCLFLIDVNEETFHQAWPLILLIPAAIFMWVAYLGMVVGKKFSKLSLALRLLAITMVVCMIGVGCFMLLFFYAYGQVWSGYQF